MIAYTEVSSNKRKTALLITSFLVLVMALGYVFDMAYGNPAILVLAVVFAVGSALFSYYFSDSITLAMSSATPVDRRSNPELYRVVENLCITAGLPTPRIYVIDDPAMNAFATGRDPAHAVVCVTSGLLQSMDKVELEGVIAHELSHVGNYDIRLSTIIVVLVGLISLMSDWFLRATMFGGGRRRSSKDGGQLQVIFFVIGIVLAIISPIIAAIIQLAVSRKREYLADASGALLTRYPEGLARALEKISQHDVALSEANKATAHLYFVNPLSLSDNQGSASQANSQSSGSWFVGLFNTHPPIQDRIKKLREMNLG